MIVVMVLALFVCIFFWVNGELTNRRLFRLAGSIGFVILSTSIAAIVAMIGGHFQTSVDLTGVVETYHKHLADHLKEGRVEFALAELEFFRNRAHATYEAGGYLAAVVECTDRLKAGPSKR